jgi:hypothetical protein
MTKNKKNKQHSLNIHKICVDRIEEMYEENKNFYKLYQDTLQKCIVLEKELNELKSDKNKQYTKRNIELTVNNLNVYSNINEINTKENQSPRLINFDKYKEYINKNNDIKIKTLPSKVTLNKCLYYYYKIKVEENNKQIEIKNKLHKNNHIGNAYYKFYIKKINEILTPPSFKKTRKLKSREDVRNHSDNGNLLNIFYRLKCPVKIYKKSNSPKSEILDLLASKNKVLIRYNSTIAEKVDDSDETTWTLLFNYLVENGDINNGDHKSKSFWIKQMKRCKILYDLYGENLKRFGIHISHMGRLSKDNWNIFLFEFDKLYKLTYKDSIKCLFIYKCDKICNKYDCKINHKPYD